MKISIPTRQYALRGAVVVVSVLLGLLAWQCLEIPAEPVAPNWNTQLSIPLVDTVYFLNEAFEGDEDITVQGDTFVYKPQRYHFEPVSIGDTTNLRLDPPTKDTTTSVELGAVDVPPPPPVDASLSASDAIGERTFTYRNPQTNQDTTITIVISETDTTTISPIPFIGFTELEARADSATLELPGLEGIDYINITSTELKLTLTNRLPTDLTSFTVNLINNNNDVLFSTVFENIQSRSVQTQTTSLSNKRLTNAMTAQVSVVVPVIQLPVTFLGSDGIDVRLEFTKPIRANEARLSVPPLVLTDTLYSEVPIDDSTYINEVNFTRGRIRLTLRNSIDAAARFYFRFNQLVKNSGEEPFILRQDVQPLGQAVIIVSLGGGPDDYKFKSSANINTLDYTLKIETLSLDRLSTIHNTDRVSAQVEFLDTPFLLSSIKGRMTPYWEVIKQTVELPEISVGSNFSADSIVLPMDKLQLRLQTAVGHPIDFYLTVQGVANNGTKLDSLKVPAQGSPDPSAWRFQPGAENTVTFEGNTFTRFLRNFPNGQPRRLIIEGKAHINPEDVYNDPANIAELKRGDSLFASADIAVPMTLGIYNGRFLDTLDIREDGDGGEMIDRDILTAIVEGRLSFKIENTIPVNLSLRVDFLDWRNRVILTPDTIAIVPGVSQPTITLTKEQALKFNDAERAIVRLLMSTHNGVAVFSKSQYIRLRVSANIVYNVNTDRLGE